MLLEDAGEPTQFQNWQMRGFPAPTAVTDNQIETEKVFLHWLSQLATEKKKRQNITIL